MPLLRHLCTFCTPRREKQIVVSVRWLKSAVQHAEPAARAVPPPQCLGTGWRFPWGLRVRLCEVLLRGVFDSLEEGAYIAEADEYLQMLQVTRMCVCVRAYEREYVCVFACVWGGEVVGVECLVFSEIRCMFVCMYDLQTLKLTGLGGK